ncbi:MAG: hypothetical protein ACXV6L_02810 [Halobacteriota archaeon]
MKQMTLIAVALCIIMLVTVGAGVVTAKQEANPRQAGESSVYFFDVAASDTHGSGKLIINVKQHTFIFNGKGFTPDTLYALQYRTASSGIHVFASGKATPSGNLHVAGTWAKDAALPTTSDFGVSATPATYDPGTLYYIPPPPGTTQEARYLFDSDFGSYYFLTFAGTAPSPVDFGSSGWVSASYWLSGQSTWVVIGDQRFDNVAKSATQQELVRHVTTTVKAGTNEYTYIVDNGFFNPSATNVYLYDLRAGAFAPGTTTEIKAAIIDTSLLYVDPNTGQWTIRVNVLLLHPLSYIGAYTKEPY